MPSAPFSAGGQEPAVPQPNFFDERPITSAAEDTLGRYLYASELAGACQEAAAQSESCVIGLTGEAGSGKSSLAAMVKERLSKEPDWLTVDFNPFMCVTSEGVLGDFFATVAEAIPRPSIMKAVGRLSLSLLPGTGWRPGEAWRELSQAWMQRQVRQKLGSLLLSIAPFGSAVKPAGVDSGKLAESAAKRLMGAPSALTQKERLAKTLRASRKNILLTIDDVDRLHHTEQQLIFKLVRQVGDLPHMYYLLPFDEEAVINGLIANKEGSDREGAEGFLRKMIQLHRRVPPLTEETLEKYVMGRFDTLVAHYLEKPLPYYERARFETLYCEGLRRHVALPRNINRFFADIDADVASLKTGVDFTDYCGIHFLRQFVPEVYGLLQEKGRELAAFDPGFPEHDIRTGQVEQPDLHEEGMRRDKWQKLVREALFPDKRQLSVEERRYSDSIFAVCAVLFPVALQPLDAYLTDDDMATGVPFRFKPTCGVSRPDYFDRYFRRGLDEAELMQNLAREALFDLNKGGRFLPSVVALQEMILTQPALAVDSLNRSILSAVRGGMSLKADGQAAILDFMATNYMHLTAFIHRTDDDRFWHDGLQNMAEAANKILASHSVENLKITLPVFEKHGSAGLALYAAAIGSKFPVPTDIEPDYGPVYEGIRMCEAYFRRHFGKHLDALLRQPLESVSAGQLVPLLFVGSKFYEPGGMASLLWSSYIQPGRVSLEALLGKILILDPRGRSVGSPAPPPLPERVQKEIEYKLRLLSSPGQDLSVPDIMEANELIVDRLLGFPEAMRQLAHPLHRAVVRPARTARDSLLHDMLSKLQWKFAKNL